MFQVGEMTQAAATCSAKLSSAWARLICDHGPGPFYIVGTHPKGLNGDQLVCLQTSGRPGKISRDNITMVDGRILVEA